MKENTIVMLAFLLLYESISKYSNEDWLDLIFFNPARIRQHLQAARKLTFGGGRGPGRVKGIKAAADLNPGVHFLCETHHFIEKNDFNPNQVTF